LKFAKTLADLTPKKSARNYLSYWKMRAKTGSKYLGVILMDLVESHI
jgi:hypothetical protein